MTSKKDQAQYWADPSKLYRFLSVSEIAAAFKNSVYGRAAESLHEVPYDKFKSHPSALSKTEYAVSNWELFRTCFIREILLIKRHSFLYIFRTCQVVCSLMSNSHILLVAFVLRFLMVLIRSFLLFFRLPLSVLLHVQCSCEQDYIRLMRNMARSISLACFLGSYI